MAACGDPVPPSEGFTLTVTVAGEGSVTSDPAGIDTAAGQASADFAANEEVTLTATPSGAANMVTWSGGDCDGSTDATCVVEMTADTEVTATFGTDEPDPEDLPFSVTVNNTGSSEGSVTSDIGGIDCPDVCEGAAPEGATVVLTAAATTGGFINWTGGDCDGQTTLTCSITVNPGEETVTANFGDVETHTETITASFVVEELINASSDDATRFPAGHNYQESSDLDINWDVAHDTQQWIGLRFDMLELPAGANVQSAVITMETTAASTDPISVTISGEAAASPAPLADDGDFTASADTSTRAANNGTDATVTWTLTSEDEWAADELVMTPDLADVVKEIVDVDGWAGSIVIFISPDADPASTSERRVKNPNEVAGTLEIEVTWTTLATP